ncbi:Conserved_hypothetical protein [Hexamita inflata]|uniref:Uncharacterized protein n=1 Tax=Hexamita inflata TaxID=28002 RepID=A0AA86TPL6_9EUKA|nr:Conserved hypothetical protein [Hexamita inflata]CAI9925631.1 Conserved hypothetical protein [Hexamita inflata]
MQYTDLLNMQVTVVLSKGIKSGVLQEETETHIVLTNPKCQEQIEKSKINKIQAKKNEQKTMPTDKQITQNKTPVQAEKSKELFKEYQFESEENAHLYEIEHLQKLSKEQKYNQFNKNEQLTGKKSDYDFNLYTVDLKGKEPNNSKDNKSTENIATTAKVENKSTEAVKTEVNLKVVQKFSLKGETVEEQKIEAIQVIDMNILRKEAEKQAAQEQVKKMKEKIPAKSKIQFGEKANQSTEQVSSKPQAYTVHQVETQPTKAKFSLKPQPEIEKKE